MLLNEFVDECRRDVGLEFMLFVLLVWPVQQGDDSSKKNVLVVLIF